MNENEQKGSHGGLLRILRLGSVIGIAVGGTIGSGIFIVPKDVAFNVHSAVLIFSVWIVGGALSYFGALSLSELGTMFPEAGGIYVYIREAFGNLVAFLYGWALFWIMDTGSVATLSVAFSSKYLPHFFALTPFQMKAISVCMIAFLAMVNYVGVRWGAFLQNVLTIMKVGAIVGISGVVFLFAHGDFSHFTATASEPFSFDLVGRFGVALVACLWAYKGWESTTFSTGEMKNVGRDLPRGLFLGTLLVVFLYLLANVAYLYVFPYEYIAYSSRIADDAMNAALGSIGASVVSFLILFSIMGAANGNVLTAPRVYFAMARDGVFFKKIASIHPKYHTPHFSIILMALWSMILCVSGTFEQLFTYVVFGVWLFLGLTVAAVIVLRKKQPERARPYKVWGYPYVPVFFVLAALFVSLNTLIQSFWNSLIGLIIIFSGLPAYYYWTRKNR